LKEGNGKERENQKPSTTYGPNRAEENRFCRGLLYWQTKSTIVVK